MQDREHRNDENLTREVEKIGSQLRSMSIQIEAIRARVSDLESWGPRHPGGTVKAGGKDEDGGKGKDENNGKGKKGGKEAATATATAMAITMKMATARASAERGRRGAGLTEGFRPDGASTDYR